MINAGAEMTMTRTHAIPNQLVQCVQALDFRKLVSLQSLFGDLFQIRDAFYRVAHHLPPVTEVTDEQYLCHFSIRGNARLQNRVSDHAVSARKWT
jgi:hypothetical protein